MQELELEGLYDDANLVHRCKNTTMYNYRINLYYRACLSIVFLPIIEKELEEYMAYWNSHCIRSSRGDCLGGIPSDLFDMPAYYGKAIEAA